MRAPELDPPKTNLSDDHFKLEDTRVTRRYFGKFERITQHLSKVAATMQAEGRLSRRDIQAIAGYLVGLNITFRSLAHKYHFSGRFSHAGQLTFDRVESGFPVYQELAMIRRRSGSEMTAIIASGFRCIGRFMTVRSICRRSI